MSQENTETKPMGFVERENRITELYNAKVALLDKYGIFGGDAEVNRLHENINKELESLGVAPE